MPARTGKEKTNSLSPPLVDVAPPLPCTEIDRSGRINRSTMNMVGKMARAGSGLVGKAARASSRSTATLLGRSGLATLVIAEHTHRALAPSTLSAITAASQLKDASGLDVLVLGSNSEGAASAAARVPGVTRVLHGDHPAFAHHIAENVSLAVARVAKEGGYTHIVAVSNMAGKNLVGRLAAELDTAPITDVVEVGTSSP